MSGAKHTPTLGLVLPLAIIKHAGTNNAVSIRDNGGRGEWVASSDTAKAEALIRACNSHDALVARIAELEPAAECWNAIAACYRITVMGFAGLVEKKDTGYAHITVNLWTCRDDPTKGVRDEQVAQGRARLGDFMEIAIKNLTAKVQS